MESYKILACGDIHLELELVKLVINLAQNNKVDLILLTGDFCNGRGLADNATVSDFLKQAKPLIKLLETIKIPIFFVLGNHDPTDLGPQLTEHSQLTDLHTKTVSWNNYTFGGIGGSHYVTPQLEGKTLPFLEGIFSEKVEMPEFEYIRTIQKMNTPIYIHSGVHVTFKMVFPCDVFITHTPPLLPDDNMHQKSSAGLYKLLEEYKPLLSISGHVHKPDWHIKPLKWTNNENKSVTTLVNLGSLDQNKVIMLELDMNDKLINDIQVVSL